MLDIIISLIARRNIRKLRTLNIDLYFFIPSAGWISSFF